MLRRFIPRETQFFELFKAIAAKITQTAKAVNVMVNDLPNAERHARLIKDLEHEADDITHQTIELLHTTFITPLDREDIHQLIKNLDNIVDFFDAAAQRIYLYEMKNALPELKGLTEICIKASELLEKVVVQIENLKNSKSITETCVEINRLENEGDLLLRAGVAKLFKNETDFKELIKQKEILELIEVATDCFEDVANTIEGIVLEYA